MICQRIGFSPISIMGFGFKWDSSEIRVPKPPARITIFITYTPFFKYILYNLIKPFPPISIIDIFFFHGCLYYKTGSIPVIVKYKSLWSPSAKIGSASVSRSITFFPGCKVISILTNVGCKDKVYLYCFPS